ncbi:MAG: DegT/DnrJ/EryC1/StrS family aminotransferase [Thermodesulfobacteriota bacterium]
MKLPYVDLAVRDPEQRRIFAEIFDKALTSGSFILGPAVDEFEGNFAAFCGVSRTIGLNSGTDALFLALKALGIGIDDEVITVSNTFVATVGAIIAAGARPVLIDVREEDMLMNPDLLTAAFTNRTKAVIPVHLAGIPCDMPAINAISATHGIAVVEDASQAIGASHSGKKTGSMGDIGCFSLHPLKNLAALGDGGVVTTNRADLAEAVLLLRNHGLKDRDTLACFGYNSRLDALQAALLNHRLKDADRVTESKQNLARLYAEHLAPLRDAGLLSFWGGNGQRIAVYHLFVIKTPHRDALQRHLTENGIETKIHYPIPIHLQRPFIERFGRTSLPVTERLAGEILSLPIWDGMSEEMVEEVCHLIHTFFVG